MAARDDFGAITKDHGALALKLYVLETKPEKSPDDVTHNLPARLDYQRDPEERGSLVFSDPRSNANGDSTEGAGLIIYCAGSMTEVWQSADAEPMYNSRARQRVAQAAGQRGLYLVERRPVHGQGPT